VPSPGALRDNPKDSLHYVWIPSGGFLRGCSKFDPNCADDEKPVREVTLLKGFWMSQTEITVRAYRHFATAMGRNMPPEPNFGGQLLNPAWNNQDAPIANVNWFEATDYCHWIGGALPTEAQWEYAARAGNTAFAYGPLTAIAWFADNAGDHPLNAAKLQQDDPGGYLYRLSQNRNTPHTVGSLTPNQFGLYDMLGNLWEWTADWYGETYYQVAERFGPKGPPNGGERVLRGGSWATPSTGTRVSARGRRSPVARSTDTGFRCVQ